MKKMLLMLVAVLTVGVVGASYYFDTLIKRGVETVGHLAQVEMRVAGISLRGIDGALVKGFSIGNPKGFSPGNAVSLDKISVTVDPGSLLAETIVIKEIAIDAPEITYEANMNGTNLGALGDAFASLGGNKESATQDDDTAKGGKKVIIEHLYVRGGKMNIAAGLAGQSMSQVVAFPDLHLTDIGKDSGGATLAQSINVVMGVVVQTAALVNADALKNAVNGLTKDAQGTLKGLTGQAESAVESLQGGAQGSSEDVKKQLKNLKDMF